MELIEYRVRPVTRYIVTRFEQFTHEDGKVSASASTVHGEYDNADTAFEVGYALCKAEHDRRGWPIADSRIQYPRHPNDPNAGPGSQARQQGIAMTASTAGLVAA